MISIADQDVVGEVDVDRLLHATAERWSVVSDRTWSIQADAGRQWCAADRLRACLDTLLEKSVRYTGPGGAVRIGAAVHEQSLLVWVADSGPGLDDALAQALNSG